MNIRKVIAEIMAGTLIALSFGLAGSLLIWFIYELWSYILGGCAHV